jgi:hypothetical protein
MCWTDRKTRVKTDCGQCDCRKSSNYGRHKPRKMEAEGNRGKIYCTGCGKLLSG